MNIFKGFANIGGVTPKIKYKQMPNQYVVFREVGLQRKSS